MRTSANGKRPHLGRTRDAAVNPRNLGLKRGRADGYPGAAKRALVERLLSLSCCLAPAQCSNSYRSHKSFQSSFLPIPDIWRRGSLLLQAATTTGKLHAIESDGGRADGAYDGGADVKCNFGKWKSIVPWPSLSPSPSVHRRKEGENAMRF